MFNPDFAGCDAIFDKKVSNVDVASASTTGCFAVLGEQNGALVVLMDDGIADGVATLGPRGSSESTKLVASGRSRRQVQLQSNF